MVPGHRGYFGVFETHSPRLLRHVVLANQDFQPPASSRDYLIDSYLPRPPRMVLRSGIESMVAVGVYADVEAEANVIDLVRASQPLTVSLFVITSDALTRCDIAMTRRRGIFSPMLAQGTGAPVQVLAARPGAAYWLVPPSCWTLPVLPATRRC